MKRITFSGGSIVTSDAIAAALLQYAGDLVDAATSGTVDITVLEDSGETSVHTLLLSPSAALDVSDADGMGSEEEARRFPLPDIPDVSTSEMTGVVESTDDSGRAATDFDQMMQEIDEGLGR